MTKITASLEAAVADYKSNEPKEGEKKTARQRVKEDRIFADILKLLAPRFRHFIRQYGLVGHWEDAEQACAIAVHRAIGAYDPEKAQFTTFVNWQIRGELQSLRFRLMTDQRPSARKVEAVTVSLDAIASNEDGEAISAVASIEDEDALSRTEAGASDYLARAAMIELTEEYINHLRKVEMERLERRSRSRARTARKAGTKPAESAGARTTAKGSVKAATVAQARSVWRAENQRVDPEELAELETKLEHNRRVVERHLFDLDLGEGAIEDTDVMRERARQIAKRAARTMCELAGLDPRFEMMAEYHQEQTTRLTVH